ncbi:MAG: DUF433 domain-containing protein [Ktedonobacterales bacterium]
MAKQQVGEIFPGIEVNPQITGGVPVIAGTRIPVEVILGHLAAGDTEEAVMSEYDLTAEHIRIAFGYAAQVVATERIYVVSAD